MKRLYENSIQTTKMAYSNAILMEDIDLKEHYEELMAKELAVSGWDPFPMTKISDKRSDFVTDLFQRYLDDLRIRKRDVENGNEGEPPASYNLRKTIKLNFIDGMVE